MAVPLRGGEGRKGLAIKKKKKKKKNLNLKQSSVCH